MEVAAAFIKSGLPDDEFRNSTIVRKGEGPA